MSEPLDEFVVRVRGDASGGVRALEETSVAGEAMEKRVSRSTRKAGESADDQAKKTGKLAEETKKASKSVVADFEKMTGSSKTAAAAFERNFARSKTATEAFDRTIRELRQQVKVLGDIYNKTGDEKFLRRMQQAKNDAEKLSKAAGDLGGVLGKDVAGGAAEAGAALEGLGPVVAGVLAAFAPLIGGALSGGVLALAGGGGIAAGIAGQLHSPLVTSAVDQFGADLKNRFDDATSAFAPQLRDTLAAIDRNTQPFWDTLKAGLTDLAPYLKMLGDGFARFMNELGPGLEAAFKGAEPVLTIIAEDLPQLGQAVTIFFQQLEAGGAGAAESIAYLFQALETAIIGVGYVLRGLSWTVDKFTNAFIKIFDALGHIPGKLGDKFKSAAANLRSMQSDAATASTNLDDLGGSFDTVSDSITRQGAALKELAGQWDDATDAAMTYDNATLRAIEANVALSKSIKENGHDWNMAHEKGRANWHALLDNIQAEKDKYDADVKINGVTLKNTTAYQSAIDKLLAQAAAAGLSKTEIDRLRLEYENLGLTLDKLNGRKVTFTIQGNVVGALPGGRASIASVLATSGVHRFARSGVTTGLGSIPAFDLTGVYAGRPGGVYRFAEASTVEEALIARNTDKGRALGALRQAAAWHDAVVVTNNVSSTYTHSAGVPPPPRAAGTTMLYATIAIDGQPVARAIVPAVQRINSRSAANIYGGP